MDIKLLRGNIWGKGDSCYMCSIDFLLKAGQGDKILSLGDKEFKSDI